MDILASGLSKGNPFYPVRNKQKLNQVDYQDEDIDFELQRPYGVPTKIFDLLKKLLKRKPAEVLFII